jgi:hypothetical protein
MEVIWQSELSGNGSYPETEIMRQSELSGNGSYPAILTKRLQRRIEGNKLNCKDIASWLNR